MIEWMPGGKGANQAAAAARLGCQVSLVGKVGNDEQGALLRADLASAGVGVQGVAMSKRPTGVAVIMVADRGENSICVASGANGDLSPEDIDGVADWSGPTLVSLEVPIATAIYALKKSQGMRILNPAPARDVPVELLASAYLITPNETEAEELTGIRPTDEAACHKCARALMELGPAAVCITLGERGSFLMCNDKATLLEPHRVQAVDSTGAGDAFNGALVSFLNEGRGLENACRLANVVGALATTRPGARGGLPSIEAVRAAAGDLF